MPLFCMQKKKNRFEIIYKGMLIGSTMLIPGVSGGSMAIILGIYDRLVGAVSSFTKNVKENIVFLLTFAVSAGIGMFLLAKPILVLWEMYPKAMGFFFMGAVAGGIPAIYKEAGIDNIKWRYVAYVLIGFGIAAVMALPGMNEMTTATGGQHSTLYLFVAGIIAAAALVLPGISVSFLLLFMGLYNELMQAVSEMNLSFLIPMGIGILLGVILVTRALETAMKKYPKITYLTILGFVIGSLIEVFPGMPVGYEWIWCASVAASGFYCIVTLSGAETK
mgnify:FL=1